MKFLIGILSCSLCFVYGEYYTPSSVKTLNGADIRISGDLLLWTARNPGLTASIGNLYVTGSNPSEEGNISEPSYKISPGFRVGIGVLLPHDASFLDLEYTRFLFTTNKAFTEVDEDVITLYPTFFASPSENWTPIFYASPSWSLELNKITAVLGRGSFIGSHTTFDPYFGLTSAFLKQDYDIEYNSIIGPSSFSFTFKQNGVGPRVGTSVTFYPYYKRFGIGIVTDLAGSMLWTKFQPEQESSSPAFTILDTNIYYKFHMVMPEIDLSLGLKIDIPSPSKRFHTSFLAAWETEVWFLGNLFTSIPLPQNNMGQFNMTGLTLQCKFDF